MIIPFVCVEFLMFFGARPAQGAATTTGDGLVRTLERASLRACGMTGARPAQGTATTTGDGLVRTLERASLLECD